ncbi:MAG TPA: hypothetical protein VGF69_15585 [Thermoanaerobaculia bacterium]|jgi:hypothetical protein
MSRIALVVCLLSLSVSPLLADHFTGECPLSLVASNPPATDFNLSPHGVFRSGNLVYVLSGQTLTTYTVNDIGDLQVAREDFIGSMGARETNGGVTFANGFLYLSSEAGLEIYDLRNVRAGGTAPVLVSRTRGLHYRRLAVNGNVLAGLYPIIDLPCVPRNTPPCTNQIDVYDISNRNNPGLLTSIRAGLRNHIAYNDIAFNFGYLVATGEGGTHTFNLTDPSNPTLAGAQNRPGKFLVSNGANLIGVGDDREILVLGLNSNGTMAPAFLFSIPQYLQIDRANPIAFHYQGWFDDNNNRLITMIDEIDPHTRKPSRTIAFDVFDWSLPQFEGSVERFYEDVTEVTPDEVKHNPVAVGPYVYTVGELSGLQTWGSCGQVIGRIEFENPSAQATCGGNEIHGWVTGTQKIANVELFLDGGLLGTATLGGVPRQDIPSRTPVSPWRINVNLDNTPRGEHVLRAVGTDILGNRRQFSSQRIFFAGPGQNCNSGRRRAIRGR